MVIECKRMRMSQAETVTPTNSKYFQLKDLGPLTRRSRISDVMKTILKSKKLLQGKNLTWYMYDGCV